MKTNIIHNHDCLDPINGLVQIPDKSVDLILCDLPYGTTRLKWDCPIDIVQLWQHYRRIIKDDRAIVLTANQPFSTSLVAAASDIYKYSWIWVKPHPTGFLNANYRPLLQFEEILVFSKAGAGGGSKNKSMLYNPQGIMECNIVKRNKKHSRGQHIHETNNVGEDNIINSDKEYIQKYTNYPSNILYFDRDSPQSHPTQKPAALIEYLIRTYSNEGEIVLDNCIGSGTTAVASIRSKRQYIGWEIDAKYYGIAMERIRNVSEKREIFDE